MLYMISSDIIFSCVVKNILLKLILPYSIFFLLGVINFYMIKSWYYFFLSEIFSIWCFLLRLKTVFLLDLPKKKLTILKNLLFFLLFFSKFSRNLSLNLSLSNFSSWMNFSILFLFLKNFFWNCEFSTHLS